MYKMVNLSPIQKKILYELGKNSRQSYKQISKNIKSKKEVIAYHINQLLEKEIITKFVPVFDLSRLGIITGKIYLRLAGLKEEQELKVLESLTKDKEISWIARSIGRWDLFLGIYSKNLNDFSRKKDEILSKLSKYVQDYDLAFIESGLVFNRDYLIGNQVSYRKEFIFEQSKISLDKLSSTEKQIIKLIKDNSRIETIEISKKLDLDARTISRNIKNLEKRGILQGYTVFLDLQKADLKLNKLCIYLKNYNEEKIREIVSYLKLNPCVIHIIKSLGKWELEAELENEDSDEIYDYINRLKNQFPESIKQIDLATIVQEIKLDFFPDEIEN